MIARRRSIVTGIVVTVALTVVGCAHDPVDPANVGNAYRSPSLRADHAPWGTVAIPLVRDRRPAHELGRRNYLKSTWISDRLFDRPVPSMLRRMLAREFDRTGVMRPIADVKRSKYVLELDVHHFAVRYSTGVAALLPILPSVDVEAVVDIEYRLVDQDGRRFVEKRFTDRDDTTTATVSNPAAVGTTMLLEILSAFVEDIVVEVDRAIPAFWAELNLPVQ